MKVLHREVLKRFKITAFSCEVASFRHFPHLQAKHSSDTFVTLGSRGMVVFRSIPWHSNSWMSCRCLTVFSGEVAHWPAFLTLSCKAQLIHFCNARISWNRRFRLLRLGVFHGTWNLSECSVCVNCLVDRWFSVSLSVRVLSCIFRNKLVLSYSKTFSGTRFLLHLLF